MKGYSDFSKNSSETSFKDLSDMTIPFEDEVLG